MAEPSPEFDWDERERILTVRKHGIDFLDAVRIFDGRPTVHAPSTRQDEELDRDRPPR